MKRTARFLAAILLCSFAPLFAQDVSTPFRGGQWAAQFGWEGGLGNLGVIAFTAPTRAWLFDVQLNWRHAEVDLTTPIDTTSGDDEFLNVIVRAGRRFYQARSTKVVTYQSLGLLGGAFRSDRILAVGFTTEGRGTAFGMFGDLGAAYAITPNLTIGFTGTLEAAYVKSRSDSPGGTSKSAGYSASAPSLSFVATIYF
jgi:hypothetical protein